MSETIEIPVSLFRRMVEAGESFQNLEAEVENFMIAKDPSLLSRLQSARESHLAGKVRPFDEIRRTE
jgi:hypothetical protein